MKPETVQLFGTLEVLCTSEYHPFLWETATQNEFDLWSLMISEGFVQSTDLELALAHWQNMEQWGAPTDLTSYEYAPPRSERQDDSWNDAIATERQTVYQQLQQYLSIHLTEPQAYTITIPRARNFEWKHPNFSVSIIVGKVNAQQWLCLVPTVPDQIGFHRQKKDNHSAENPTDSPLPSQFIPLLKALKPIPLFGYYRGGYDYEYMHQIFLAIAPSKNSAIAQALTAAQMIILNENNPVDRSHCSSEQNYKQFMHEKLSDRRSFSISFWDLGYSYEVGRTPSSDWIGTREFAEFEYNP